MVTYFLTTSLPTGKSGCIHKTCFDLLQVNFVACQLFALVIACWFRLYLHPSKTSPFIRHVVATLLGFYLALFCFGW